MLSLSGFKRHYPLLKGAIFRRRIGTVYAVDGIDLEIKAVPPLDIGIGTPTNKAWVYGYVGASKTEATIESRGSSSDLG